MKIKLDDLAKHLDLSVAAVSMALNNKKGVSDQTRDRVLGAAQEMGYKVKSTDMAIVEERNANRFIKLIRLKKHGLVAADTAFFAEVVEGIEEESRSNGFQLLVSNYYVDELTDALFESENYEQVAGVIIFATELESDDVNAFRALKRKFVVLDSYFVDHEWNTVLINNHSAVYQAVKYLKSNGHVGIGYLKSNTPIYNFEKRFNGYQEALQMMGLDYEEKFTIELEPTLSGAQRDMEIRFKQLQKLELPTAFLADNDIIAVGAMNAMKMNGIKIPEDVSIIGIDDMPFCQVVDPKLTTIKIYKREMGREAVLLLLSAINQECQYTQKREINTELINRDSVCDLRVL